MKISIIGTRGVPARYGGFETFADELGARLVKRGHEVTVYCRRRFGAKDENSEIYKGMKRVVLPAPHHKYLETPVHTFFSFLHLLFHRTDIALLCNAANSPVAWIGRIGLIPVVINVDGIERRRKKWNILGRLWYRLGEFCSVLFANRIVSDADVISDYYKDKFHRTSTVIRYGANDVKEPNDEVLKQYNLEKFGYWLYVARLEPENNALGVIQAYVQSKSKLPLVVVGDAPYAKDYIQQLHDVANENVIFTGYQFEDVYRSLGKYCYAYFQASEVGGTHPALVEAMARGNCIIANNVPEHTEVVADAGGYYPFNDFVELSKIISTLETNPQQVEKYRQLASARAKEYYSWDVITDQYLDLFNELVNR